MSGKTAWASSSSSLLSDRIAPRNASASSKSKPASRTGSITPAGTATPRKSPEARRLEGFRDGLARLVSSGMVPEKDPQGGCFCQARTHPLSKYTPACSSCGLPLCSLNQPTFSCPSCHAALLSPPALQSLLSTVENDLQAVLQKEEDERRRIIEEHKRIEGGFPTLGAAAAAASSTGDASGRIDSQQPQSYKVLSLTGNGKKKKPVVSTFTKKPKQSPQSSLPASRAESPSGFDTPERRVPPPPPEVVVPSVSAQKARDRPWINWREEVTYVRAH